MLGRGQAKFFPGTTAGTALVLRDGARYDLVREKAL